MSKRKTPLSLNICWLQGRFGLEKSLEMTAKAGFDEIDYSLEPGDALQTPGNIWMSDAWEEEAHRVKELALSYGLPITQIHTPFLFRGGDKLEYAENVMVPTINRSLDIAAVLGAKTAVQHRFFRQALRKVVEHADEVGVTLCLENGWGRDAKRGLCIASHDLSVCGPSTPESHLEYIKMVGSDKTRACLDTGHAALPINGPELWEYIHGLGKDMLQALHVQDNNMRGSDEHKFPFFGAIEWEKVAKALGEIDYEGSFTYEAYGLIGGNMPDEFAPTAVKYAADIGRFLCNIIDENRPN